METVPDDRELAASAAAVAQALLARGWRLATAESCTGGWVAKLATDIAGSSVWFECGWVTYSNAAKTEQLDVPASHFERFGAVSEEVVEAMALGALVNSDADVAVAVSGVAGPDGGTPDKPVGTVWLAWAGPWGCETRRQRFDGDRDAVRRQAVQQTLTGLQQVLDGR